MDTYERIFEWLVADAEANDSDLTPSMLAHKASKLANKGYQVVDGELVAPDSDSERTFPDEKRKKTIGFTDEDFEDLG